MQLVVDGAKGGTARTFEVYSKGDDDEAWLLHAEGRLSPDPGQRGMGNRIDLGTLKASLSPQDVAAYYRDKSATGIEFGPSLRTVESLWGAGGEAVGDVVLQAAGDGNDAGIHPLLLDGCFQVLSATRSLSGIGGDATYLPFGWERLRLNGAAARPDRLPRTAEGRRSSAGRGRSGAGGTRDPDRRPVAVFPGGGRSRRVDRIRPEAGHTGRPPVIHRGLSDLLYEVVWRERPLAGGLQSADSLTGPSTVAAGTGAFAEYLSNEGVEVGDRAALLNDLERLSRSFSLAALEELGWRRETGAEIDPATLRERLEVIPEHARLLERMLRLLADGGVLEHTPGGYGVVVSAEDPLPDEALADPEAFADRMVELHPHGTNEIGLLRRSGGALADVLRGEVDPLSILFPREGPGAADFYFTAPASRASNRLLADAVAATVADWPEGRRLRILEVGAGTGSGTSVVLPELPAGGFDYVFTDISAGFFAGPRNASAIPERR